MAPDHKPGPRSAPPSASAPDDTAPEVRAMMLAAYRRMSPAEKLQRVLDLNRAAESLARARIRRQYGPDLPRREEDLRLASLYLDRETMIRAFGWDPEVHGR
ncbi:MAG: hypothetical protein ACOC92_01125 [bacterium]